MQLNKYIAHAGVTSRRKAVELIKTGTVQVNNITVKDPAYQVRLHDVITVNGKLLSQEKKVYLLLNKPKGYVTTVSDERNRKTVLDLIGPSVTERVYPIGRLDRETTGLLLLTNDGELAQHLAHPKYQIEKVYHVVLDHVCTLADIKKMCMGVMLPDGVVLVDKVSYIHDKHKNHVHVSVHSGKYRIVRRLFEALGYNVIKLDRIRYAGLTKRGLPVGQWRMLTYNEIDALQKLSSCETMI